MDYLIEYADPNEGYIVTDEHEFDTTDQLASHLGYLESIGATEIRVTRTDKDD
jgi:Uri superfamily endonuclease